MRFIESVLAQSQLTTSTSFGTVGNLAEYVGLVLKWLVPAAIFLAVFMVFWAGYDYIVSRGDPEGVKSAKARLLGTLGGVALLLLIRFIYTILI